MLCLFCPLGLKALLGGVTGVNNTLGLNTDGVRAVEVQARAPCVLKNKAYFILCVGSSELAQDFTPDTQQSDTSSTALKRCRNTSYHHCKLPLRSRAF